MKRLRRNFIRLGCLFLPLLFVGGGALWVRHQLGPVSRSHRQVTVLIPPGTGAAQASSLLQKRGVIHSARVFLWYARWRGDASRIKAGEYHLSPDMTAAQILDRLMRGGSDADDRTVTIPEGFTLAQIADALYEKGVIADRKAFLRIVRSRKPPLNAPFPLPKVGLEGYLYPETYRFLPRSKPQGVAQAMLDAFTKEFYEPNREAVAGSGYSLHEIVTIASLIEREAEVPQDRARVAGVIVNRLKKKMRLDIDATVLYALGHHKDRVLYKDLQVNSPYNTYRRAGLPPGPIASPGKASLEAALNPERHDYLYYVAAPDGSHVFTRTYAEHAKAVAQMRALRKRETGEPQG
jgi:UPF0755 protein